MSGEQRAPTNTNPRLLAWRVLQRVETGAHADAVLGRTLSAASLTAKDRALAVRLVYGTLAWQLYLDYLLQQFCHQPLEKLDPPIRVLLRLALFQICFLDKVPPFAAVDTAVDLAKTHKHGAAVPLVNAVLRRAARGWKDVPLPERERDLAAYLSVRYSHPRWLVEAWLSQYDEIETELLLEANNQVSPTALRVNRLRGTREHLLREFRAQGLEAEPGNYSPDAVLVRGFDPLHHPLFEQGVYSVQSEAAQLVSYLVAPQPGELVLDLCAAPGGKATHLAELMSNQGIVVAVDASRPGIERVQQECSRLGIGIVEPYLADARLWEPQAQQRFDRVLLDAPCSGLGTLREHPEIRWRRTSESVRELAQLQRELLQQAARWTRPGGLLVYATCTLLREENEEVIAHFLAERRDFALSRIPEQLPPSIQALVDSQGFFRTMPHRHDVDGFFAVRLQRRHDEGNVAP
ncbi:MAG: 16S rRNA (cytosine(967)-C(5))-methyltransferase RsmB [Candidatus Binatia bacterium]|nr:16S rRNA (cytosine(967)-C(5))-methyltransferase RsmB [Candidatus Binatia bacterium]